MFTVQIALVAVFTVLTVHIAFVEILTVITVHIAFVAILTVLTVHITAVPQYFVGLLYSSRALVLRVTCVSLSWTTGWWIPTRPPFSSLPSAPDRQPARLESARSNLIFTIILRYRSVESDLRVSLVNNGLVGPYSATVLVTLPSAPDHRPPRLASAR
ncbi:hypothetical protein TNCV_3195091 [Trichonephila clavipes]|uniref:Uncharacterized protein n=1 Tax=Trichonephila clavipes TaxID=2585209 RepID=A0A8X6USD2_TRICX|nr:hypothetical protein TNCV_3195091 [Trichonephila clavipes]